MYNRSENHLPYPQEAGAGFDLLVLPADMVRRRVLIATSNQGKLRDFAAGAATYGIEIVPVPGFDELPGVVEDGVTFEDNAKKKAEHYSRQVPGELVLADDSGLAVDALGGAPGVHSARYAAGPEQENSSDFANNARLLREMEEVENGRRAAQFVCAIAAARDGRMRATFRGVAEGQILRQPRGTAGFGYDPLFYFPALGKTFAELTPEEKAAVSHRGAAFRKFLEWYRSMAT
jgi:XTP/dITP diphosphohydrolase